MTTHTLITLTTTIVVPAVPLTACSGSCAPDPPMARCVVGVHVRGNNRSSCAVYAHGTRLERRAFGRYRAALSPAPKETGEGSCGLPQLRDLHAQKVRVRRLHTHTHTHTHT